MNRLVEVQRQRNQSRLAFEPTDSQHRQSCSRLMVAGASGPDASLCVLGVGYGSDLHISQIAEAYASIHLVDLDDDALNSTVQRFRDARHRCRVSSQSADVTGVFDALTEVDSNALHAHLPERVQQCEAKVVESFGGRRFDCVSSTCLLSQIIDAAQLAIGQPPELIELLMALRRQHLRLLVQLLKPRGMGLLITDFVSSQTIPDMAAMSESEFIQQVRQAIGDQNFFTACNPLAIRNQLETEAWFKQRVESVRLSRPWRWSLGRKQLAVVAISFTKTTADIA